VLLLTVLAVLAADDASPCAGETVGTPKMPPRTPSANHLMGLATAGTANGMAASPQSRATAVHKDPSCEFFM